MRRWLLAHVGASYLSLSGVAALHVAEHYPAPRAYSYITEMDPTSALFMAAAPLSVPLSLVGAPIVAVGKGRPPTPGYFTLAVTNAASFLLIARATKTRTPGAG